MTGSSDQALEELRVLLLRYLEGSLAKEDELKVLDLLRTSEQAKRELDGLRIIVDALNTDQTIFCTDPSDIADFVAAGDDPCGRISAHLEECRSCLEEVQSLWSLHPSDGIPPQILETVRRKLAEVSPKDACFSPESISTTEDVEGSWDGILLDESPVEEASFCMEEVEPEPNSELQSNTEISYFPHPPRINLSPVHAPLLRRKRRSFFRRHLLAIGVAVGVALLLIVFLYSRYPVSRSLALSTVKWEAGVPAQVPQLPHGRERVAFVILLHDFKSPMPQQRIDSLYEALKPDEQAYKQYDLMIPSRVKDALGSSEVSNALPAAIGNTLRKKLDVQRLVVLTLMSEKNRIMVKTASLDTASGGTVGKTVEAAATEETLESTLRELAYSCLGSTGSKGGRQ